MAEPNEPKAPFTDEQTDHLKQIVSGIVNSAISARDKMSDKKRAEDREALKSDFAKMLEDLKGTIRPPEPEEGKEGGKRGKQPDNSVEMQTLRKEISELKSRAEASDQRAADAERKNRDIALRQNATDELSKVGIQGNNARLALSVLLQEGRIAYDKDVGVGEDDKLLFHAEEGWVELPSGLKSWAKTADAKIFLPAAGAAGAGTRPARGTQNGAPEKLTPEQQKANLGQALDRLLG